jgi:CDGSH-type Zn-finger protein
MRSGEQPIRLAIRLESARCPARLAPSKRSATNHQLSAMTTTSHPLPLTLQAGTQALCTCGLSKNGAFCDGSHQGSGQVPHILKLEEEKTVYLCNCGASGNKPFCDGSHAKTSA